MKRIKILTLITALIILFAAVSCSAQGNSKETGESETVTVPESSVVSSETEPSTVTETETETESGTVPETENKAETQAETESETTSKATKKTASTKKTAKKAAVKNSSPKWVRNLPQAKNSKNKQLIVVAASGMNKTTAKVSMHERDSNGNWVQVLSADGYVGKKGLVRDSKRKEGCMRTPIGVYVIDKAFGIASDPGCAIPYTKVTKDLYWSGDQRKGMHYNQMVSINDLPGLDKSISEHLIDYKKPYQYCLNIGFNKKCTIGKGSAIFLHCFSSKKYTAGCVAVSKSNMLKIMKRVKPGCVVVINTKAKLGA